MGEQSLERIFKLMQTQEPLQVLGLEEGASKKEIRKRFLVLSKKWHPAKCQSSAASDVKYANEIFICVKKAYEKVKNGTVPSPAVAEFSKDSMTVASGISNTKASVLGVTFDRAKEYLRQQQWARARRTLQSLVEKKPNDKALTALMHSAWGFEYLVRGELQKARGEFAFALKLNPQLRLALKGLSETDARSKGVAR